MSVDKIKERAYFMQITSHESLNRDRTKADEYVLTRTNHRKSEEKFNKSLVSNGVFLKCPLLRGVSPKNPIVLFADEVLRIWNSRLYLNQTIFGDFWNNSWIHHLFLPTSLKIAKKLPIWVKHSEFLKKIMICPLVSKNQFCQWW